MPGGDAPRVARCPGRAPRLPLLAHPLSDRHIGAALGGRGSRGKGAAQAGMRGSCGQCGGGSGRAVGLCSAAFGCHISVPLPACRSVPGTSGRRRWLARAAAPQGAGPGAAGSAGMSGAGGWAALSGFCLPGDGASGMPASSLARLPSQHGKQWQQGAQATWGERSCDPVLTLQGCVEG